MQSLWMLFAALVFSIMGVCVKLASNWYSTSEIVMYRGAIGVVFMSILIRLHGGSIKTTLPWHHLWRGISGSTALWLWFYAIGNLPLATAMTLNYMSPIWIAAIVFGVAWWRGGQRFEWGLACAIAISFIGVVLLLRPSLHAEQWLGALLALISGMLTALAYLEVRKLGQMGEPEYRIVFYFSMVGMVAGMLGMATDAIFSMQARPTTPSDNSLIGIALLLGVGLFATVAQIAMTRAYRFGRMLVTANLQYSGIVFASLWGILLWGDVLPWVSWLGIAIILASGVAATYYNARNTAKTAHATHPTGTPQASDPIASEI